MRVGSYYDHIPLNLFHNFLVQKWAVCRKTNVYASLPAPHHNFSTTYRQHFVERENRDFLDKIERKACFENEPSQYLFFEFFGQEEILGAPRMEKVLLIHGHDPEQWQRIRNAPAYYE